jgi:hypothetical protein
MYVCMYCVELYTFRSNNVRHMSVSPLAAHRCRAVWSARSCVCMYVYVCVCMYVCVLVCMYVCMYMCVYVCRCVGV